MILTLKTATKKKFFKEVVEYYDAWGIPADETGRTDGRKMYCSSNNPGYKDNIPDDKMLVTVKEGYEILLCKNTAILSIFSLEIHFKNSNRYLCTASFINEKQIEITNIRPY